MKFLRYPEISEVTPFLGWDVAKPTQSLAWYDAYSKVKHDREAHFALACLQHAIDSVAACVVMLAAQFGEPALRAYRIHPMFQFTAVPTWEAELWCYGTSSPADWQAVPYSF